MKLNPVCGIRKPPLRDYFENRTFEMEVDQAKESFGRTATNIARLPPVAFPAVRRLRFLYLPA
jgi:hypothetical protein